MRPAALVERLLVALRRLLRLELRGAERLGEGVALEAERLEPPAKLLRAQPTFDELLEEPLGERARLDVGERAAAAAALAPRAARLVLDPRRLHLELRLERLDLVVDLARLRVVPFGLEQRLPFACGVAAGGELRALLGGALELDAPRALAQPSRELAFDRLLHRRRARRAARRRADPAAAAAGRRGRVARRVGAAAAAVPRPDLACSRRRRWTAATSSVRRFRIASCLACAESSRWCSSFETRASRRSCEISRIRACRQSRY